MNSSVGAEGKSLDNNIIDLVSYFNIMHHLKVEEVCWAFQDEGGAHVWGGVVKVKDDIICLWASFGSEQPIYFLGSLDFIWQTFNIWSTVVGKILININNTIIINKTQQNGQLIKQLIFNSKHKEKNNFWSMFKKF